ncbi:peptidase M20 domain-containing protein 2-like [Amblyomma americanum]|uniref:Peptidase M20 domain-containing protein 2 n=1 Tax=Amblyomma americanum TaxID=6943 RepID=A0AAQ4FBM0_AMBAM
MSDMSEFIVSTIDKYREKLNLVSQTIWKNPELYYREVKAHDYLSQALEDEGFQVQRKYHLDTAFRAEYSNVLGGPVICIICEYDALPVIGHACGHNLIAEAGFAAGVAVKEALRSDPKLKGKVVVLGTPAEESGGGKIDLINAGAFADIDVAMMVHPSRSNELAPLFIGVGHISVEYHGKAAHSSGAPWDGVNAVDAAVMCYNGLSYLRQHIKPHCRVGAIFTNGGAAANIIPERSAMDILYRAPTVAMMEELRKKVMSCISAGAEATGCSMEITRSFSFKPIVTNSVIAQLYKKHAEALGVEFDDANPKATLFVASSDMGDVCHTVPSIHPIYRIDTAGPNHTKEFTDAAGHPCAQEPTLVAAKAMALACLDILLNPDVLIPKAKAAFAADMEQSCGR